jgi:hypothetical protein
MTAGELSQNCKLLRQITVQDGSGRHSRRYGGRVRGERWCLRQAVVETPRIRKIVGAGRGSGGVKAAGQRCLGVGELYNSESGAGWKLPSRRFTRHLFYGIEFALRGVESDEFGAAEASRGWGICPVSGGSRRDRYR